MHEFFVLNDFCKLSRAERTSFKAFSHGVSRYVTTELIFLFTL